MSQACQGCRFWSRAGVAPRGHCRRHAPAQGRFGHGTWPETGADQWCGSFKAAPSIEGEKPAEAGKET